MPRPLPWSQVQSRSEAVLCRLESAGVTDRAVLADVLDVLLADVPASARHNKQKRQQKKPASFASMLDRIERRIDLLEDDPLIVAAGWRVLEAVGRALLPERYGEPPPPKAATDAPPGSVAKREAMAARAAAKRGLRHELDAKELPDNLAYVASSDDHCGALARRSVRAGSKRILLEEDLPLVDLRGQAPAEAGPPTLDEGDPPDDYDPAGYLIIAKGDGPAGGEGKHRHRAADV